MFILGIIRLLYLMVARGLVAIAILVFICLRVCRVECRPFELQLSMIIEG